MRVADLPKLVRSGSVPRRSSRGVHPFKLHPVRSKQQAGTSVQGFQYDREMRRRFDLLPYRNYDWGMIAMAVQDDWIPVEKAAEIAGCSPQYVRRDLDSHLPRGDDGEPTSDRTVGGRLEGWRVHGKAWLVSLRSAKAMRETLSTRAKLHEGKRAAKKTVQKKTARRKK
jgi:hypothetical protein